MDPPQALGKVVERFLRAWIARDVRDEVRRMKTVLERDRSVSN
jgi:hypothetical protein